MVKKINNGKKFETEFMDSVSEEGMLVERFLDSNKFGTNSMTRFTSHNPADCFFYDKYGHLIYVELKSCSGTAFSVQKDWISNDGLIHFRQIDSLVRRSIFKDVHGIFLLSFLKTGNVYWISATDLLIFITAGTKKSINEQDLEDLFYFPLDQKQIRKTNKIHYSIEDLCNGVRGCDGGFGSDYDTHLAILEKNDILKKAFKAEKSKQKALDAIQSDEI